MFVYQPRAKGRWGRSERGLQGLAGPSGDGAAQTPPVPGDISQKSKATPAPARECHVLLRNTLSYISGLLKACTPPDLGQRIITGLVLTDLAMGRNKRDVAICKDKISSHTRKCRHHQSLW